MSSPWESCPKVWKDEMAFLNWLRSQTRKTWNRHPVKNAYVTARMVPIEKLFLVNVHGATARSKKAGQCEMCNEWFVRNRLQVDHIYGGVGFKDWDGYLVWHRRMLFVSFDDLRLLCKGCHEIVTASQRFNCSLDEAVLRKQLAKFRAMTATAQRQELDNNSLDTTGNKVVRELRYWKNLIGDL